jgi:catechol 2,3-dioxygenase-like lactoylglutathione lyase family enzyme
MSVSSLVTGIQHIGVPTNDIEKTIDFFESLGFKEAYSTENNGEKVVFLKLKNIVIETYENKKATEQPGAIDHIALDVSDIEKTYKEVRKLGYAELENGVQSLPFWRHGVRFFTIMGPDCEKVEFSQMLTD